MVGVLRDVAASNRPASCFKAYDLRGRVPGELDEDLAFRLGLAYARRFRPGCIAVGRDARLSGLSLLNALAHGLVRGGAEVLDLGLCGTEEVYFAAFQPGCDGGIMVTASHNPPEWNGMKLVRGGAVPISGDSGLRELEAEVERVRRRRTKRPGADDADLVPRGLRAAPARLHRRCPPAPAEGAVSMPATAAPDWWWMRWLRICRCASYASATSPTGTFRTACPIRCCRKTVRRPPRPCARTARISASPGTAISIAVSCSTSAGASSRAITSSACWPRRSCSSIPARRSSTIRA